MPYHVYILASQKHGTLYVGHMNDLARRVWEHREGAVPGFTQRYGVRRLVYFKTPRHHSGPVVAGEESSQGMVAGRAGVHA